MSVYGSSIITEFCVSLQTSAKGISQHLMLLLGGFETTTGEQVCPLIFWHKFFNFTSILLIYIREVYLIQWLAFRDDGKYSAADYAKVASERVSKDSSWNRFERGEAVKRRQRFILRLLQGAMRGLAYMHDHDRLHQSLGPFSVALKYATSKHLILFNIFHLALLCLLLFLPLMCLNCNMMAARFLKEKLPI